MKKRVCLVLGTRPEIVKMSPIIRYCVAEEIYFFVIHTGQHYSPGMDANFFKELRLPKPNYRLKTSQKEPEQIKGMIAGISAVFSRDRPDVVLVQGDTNSVLAGALAASAIDIPVGHVEAGLRSFDRSMPEETNRTLADHLSTYLFAPTPNARENAVKEYIAKDRIYVTGNTIVDAVQQNLKRFRQSTILHKLGLEKQGYALVTAHRQENVDNKERFNSIMRALDMVHERTGLEVLYPIHPRSKKMMKKFGIRTKRTRLIKPMGYMDFLQLESNARLILTDSGGIQEEACILGVPCVTMRDNTERPETIAVGANILAGTEPKNILAATEKILSSSRKWKNPFGDGLSAERIMRIVMK